MVAPAHVPEQQSLAERQPAEAPPHAHAPASQVLEQHSGPLAHVAPIAEQAHCPPTHVPEAQREGSVHGALDGAGAHVPAGPHAPEQQPVPSLPPIGTHAEPSVTQQVPSMHVWTEIGRAHV